MITKKLRDDLLELQNNIYKLTGDHIELGHLIKAAELGYHYGFTEPKTSDEEPTIMYNANFTDSELSAMRKLNGN